MCLYLYTLLFCRSRRLLRVERRARVRELRRHLYAPVEARRDGPLPLQRLRTLQQDERHEQAAHETPEETAWAPGGTFISCFLMSHLTTQTSLLKRQSNR
ncbi:hypothetical protein TNCV_171071 [Trichonephila clavipes]|nr:hypothetical protein TNCV_171071 [Trichonephila clavipes]